MIKPPEAFFEEIRAIHGGNRDTRDATGWTDFDNLIGGLRRNELTVLTGETGSGTDSFSVNLAYRLAQKGHPVLIASFETKPLPILKKMVQAKTRQPLTRVSRPELDSALQHILTLPVFFVDVYGELGCRN